MTMSIHIQQFSGQKISRNVSARRRLVLRPRINFVNAFFRCFGPLSNHFPLREKNQQGDKAMYKAFDVIALPYVTLIELVAEETLCSNVLKVSESLRRKEE